MASGSLLVQSKLEPGMCQKEHRKALTRLQILLWPSREHMVCAVGKSKDLDAWNILSALKASRLIMRYKFYDRKALMF
jgi:hypothetical protein